MSKKTRSAIIFVLLAVFCLGVLTSCNAKTINIFDYSDDNLGLVGKLVRLMHQWIGNYGWTVVVFTVFLKIIMLPLDFWQRYSSRKNTLKMQKMQPLLEGIDKRYGANTPRANEEKQKLYKKQGTGMFGMCLPMILSMVIFFVMFAGLRNYSTYSSVTTFTELSLEYYRVNAEKIIENGGTDAELYQQKYKEEYDRYFNQKLQEVGDESKVNKVAVEIYARAEANTVVSQEVRIPAQSAALEAIKEYYTQGKLNDEGTRGKPLQERWLWIQNVWQPDTWETVMPAFKGGQNAFTVTVNMDGFPDGENGQTTYNLIRNAVLETGERGSEGKWNGLLILPILSIALSFLSMFLSQLMEKKNRKGEQVAQNQQQAATNKVMMILMPLMMAYFGFIYTGAFAIYMVVNYTLSILATIGLRKPVEIMVNKNFAKLEEKENSGKANYMR